VFSHEKKLEGVSMNFINQIGRTLGYAVDKVLNGSTVTHNSRRQFIFGKQSLGLFPRTQRQHSFPRKPKAEFFAYSKHG